MTESQYKFFRLVNGGWGCDIGDVSVRLFKAYGAKGLWRWKVRVYWNGDQFDEVSTTRKEGVSLALEMVEDKRQALSDRK